MPPTPGSPDPKDPEQGAISNPGTPEIMVTVSCSNDEQPQQVRDEPTPSGTDSPTLDTSAPAGQTDSPTLDTPGLEERPPIRTPVEGKDETELCSEPPIVQQVTLVSDARVDNMEVDELLRYQGVLFQYQKLVMQASERVHKRLRTVYHQRSHGHDADDPRWLANRCL